MSIIMQINPFDFFTDTNGDALDAGYIWIGEVNKDPRQYPIIAYYDAALTIPAPMPLRTSNGYIVRNGAPTFLYISGNYSVMVLSSNGGQVYYIPDFLLSGNGAAVSLGDISNTADVTKGISLIPTASRLVPNIAILRTLPKTGGSVAVFVEGYYSIGDGGGGNYYLDPLDVTSIDNGGSLIVASDGGRWKLNHQGIIDVRQFGAKVNMDMTTSARAALTAMSAAGGGTVNVPDGKWILSGTLTITSGVAFKGRGGTRTILYRESSYGDTIYQETGFAVITGFFFQHGTNNPTTGTALDFRLTDQSGHIHLKNTQNADISDNIIWRMPYGVINDGAINTKIQRCWIQGIWDPQRVAMQEGLADVLFVGNTQHCQLAKIRDCYFSGAPGPTRNTTWSDGVNSVTASVVSNIGSVASIQAISIEDLDITGCYFGRCAFSLIHLNPAGATGIIADVRLTNCFFDNVGDGSISRQILIDATELDKYILGLSISACTFNGEYDSNNGILVAANSLNGLPTVVNLSITGNNFFAHTATPIVLLGAKDGSITGNTFQNWNSRGAALESSTNNTYRPPVYIGPGSPSISVRGNTAGGGGNDGGAAGNFCWGQVYIDPTTIGSNAGDNLYSGLKSGAGYRVGIAENEDVIIDTAAGNYGMPQGKNTYIRNKTITIASIVVLPVYPVTGQTVLVKDGKGDATAGFFLQISTGDGTLIDGAASSTITTAFAFQKFMFNGIQWNRIG